VKKEEVPQDFGPEAELKRLMWATDENGKFVTVQSVGWDPSNSSFNKYWEYMGDIIHHARHDVERGEKSPLWYWMKLNVLDEPMLADYMGLWTWRVRRHMKPKVFAKLSDEMLARYAVIFHITPDEVRVLPAEDPKDLPIPPEALERR
jgi:hypothetical protein